MGQNSGKSDSKESRSVSREKIDKFYSVEFSIKGLESVYQFRIWNLSQKGMCVLVKEDSSIFPHLKVGERFKMKYYPSEMLEPIEYLDTEVKHITKDEKGRFKGHYMIGLSVLEH